MNDSQDAWLRRRNKPNILKYIILLSTRKSGNKLTEETIQVAKDYIEELGKFSYPKFTEPQKLRLKEIFGWSFLKT